MYSIYYNKNKFSHNIDMQLTGKQIIEKQIVNGVEHPDKQIQQQGVDLRIFSVYSVGGPAGFIPANGKTITPEHERVPISFADGNVVKYIPAGTKYWALEPGYYEIEFMEGCNIPSNATLHLKTRSSLVRCGAQVFSGQFDAGFKTDFMGGFLQVNLPIYIERGARVAQALVFESADVDQEHMYNGQWQGDKQRNI
jgi:deoxycytidine triphosphate deaminase